MQEIEKNLPKTGIPAIDALFDKYVKEDRVWGDTGMRPSVPKPGRHNIENDLPPLPNLVTGDSGAASSGLLRVIVLGAVVTAGWYLYGHIQTLTVQNPAATTPTQNQTAATDTLTGTWQSGEGTAGILLSLRQTGSRLSGWHCASSVSPETKEVRSDCPFADDHHTTISGTVSGNAADVSYVAWNGTPGGKARIVRQGNVLVWELLEAPKGVYALATSTLQLVSVTALP